MMILYFQTERQFCISTFDIFVFLDINFLYFLKYYFCISGENIFTVS